MSAVGTGAARADSARTTGAGAAGTGHVATGVDRLIGDPRLQSDLLGDARVGLVTNFTGVTRSLDRTVDALAAAGVRLVAVFGPEHGLRGTAQAGASETATTDEATGLPVVDTYMLAADRLDAAIVEAGVEVLVFDMQDVGTRYWTYSSTMFDLMAAARRVGVRFVVLDRPNPLGGAAVEGPGLSPEVASFVGRIDVPLRHGLTSGELARVFVRRAPAIGVRLADPEVVAVSGWEARPAFPSTSLPWVPPSPNLPTVDTAFVYPATGIVEGTNLSEGRGTTRPFEIVGAPWIDGRLVPLLRDQGLPGVAFRDTWFQPTFHKYAGTPSRGVMLHVHDRDTFEPVRTGLTLLWAVASLHPEFAVLRPGERAVDEEPGFALDRLWGSSALRDVLDAGGDPRTLSTGVRHVADEYPVGILS